MTPVTLLQYIKVLRDEIELLKSRLLDHDTGHIHTTIGVLSARIDELEKEELEQQKTRNR